MAVDVKRVVTGLSISAVLVTVVCLIPVGHWVAMLLFAAVGGLAQLEFYRLLKAGAVPVSMKWGTAMGVLFSLATFASVRFGWDDSVLWCVLLFCMISIAIRNLMCARMEVGLQTMSGTMLGFAYVAVLWSFMIRVFMSGDLSRAGWPGLFLLLLVKMGDTGAYFAGSTLGRRKLAPRISPKKTWEGFAGGVLLSSLIAFLWALFAKKLFAVPLGHALIMGALVHVVGTLGDLVESMFKRAVAVKDSSGLAHGVGGILDMVDSVLFAAPFVYIYFSLFIK